MTDPLPCSPAREHLLQLTLKGKRTERRKLPCAFLKDKQIQTKLAQSAAGTSLSWENGPLHILAVNPTSEIWRLGSFIPCSDWRGWGERESEGHILCPWQNLLLLTGYTSGTRSQTPAQIWAFCFAFSPSLFKILLSEISSLVTRSQGKETAAN